MQKPPDLAMPSWGKVFGGQPGFGFFAPPQPTIFKIAQQTQRNWNFCKANAPAAPALQSINKNVYLQPSDYQLTKEWSNRRIKRVTIF